MWKQWRCPSIGEWINEQWYIHTIEYFSAIKINELSNHRKTWRNFICILLREKSQFEEVTNYMIPSIWHCRKGKTMETVERWVFARARGKEEWVSRAQKTFRSRKPLYDSIMVGTWHYTYVKTHRMWKI